MNKINYYTALDKYFTLKNKYENKLLNQKKKIFLDNFLSLKDKRKKMKQIIAKCVYCGRNVGTQFIEKDRLYIAKCGDEKKPCKLNIQLKKPNTYNVNNLSDLIHKNLNEDKLNIIKVKLDHIYGLIDNEELDKVFNDLKDVYDDDMKFFDILEEYFKQLKERKQGIEELYREFYDNISSLKDTMREFNKSHNKKYVSDAIDYYKNITDLSKEIRNIKYDNMYLDFDDKHIYLNQEKVSKKNSEIILIPEEVISFVI